MKPFPAERVVLARFMSLKLLLKSFEFSRFNVLFVRVIARLVVGCLLIESLEAFVLVCVKLDNCTLLGIAIETELFVNCLLLLLSLVGDGVFCLLMS